MRVSNRFESVLPIEAAILVKTPDQSGSTSFGKHRFAVLPRIGEHIELERNGRGVLSRVTQICYPLRGNGVIDLLVLELGFTEEIMDTFLGEKTETSPEGLSSTVN